MMGGFEYCLKGSVQCLKTVESSCEKMDFYENRLRFGLSLMKFENFWGFRFLKLKSNYLLNCMLFSNLNFSDKSKLIC